MAWEGREPERFTRRANRQPQQLAEQVNSPLAAIETDLAFADRFLQADITKRELGKGAEIRPDNRIQLETGVLEAHIDLRPLDHVPPIAFAAAALWKAAELEADDGAARRDLIRIDLAAHAIHQHGRI